MPKEIFQKTKTNSGADFDCITDFEVSHYRASEGYKNNYYDIMGDDGNKKKYYVTLPDNDGDLYWTAETYYREMVPTECINGGSVPQIWFSVYHIGENKNTKAGSQWYEEQFSRFVMVSESSYRSGDVYRAAVQMKEWRGYPNAHRDITVAIYSKQTLNITDASGKNYQEHYDGSLPTGFTESTYRNGVNYDE